MSIAAPHKRLEVLARQDVHQARPSPGASPGASSSSTTVTVHSPSRSAAASRRSTGSSAVSSLPSGTPAAGGRAHLALHPRPIVGLVVAAKAGSSVTTYLRSGWSRAGRRGTGPAILARVLSVWSLRSIFLRRDIDRRIAQHRGLAGQHIAGRQCSASAATAGWAGGTHSRPGRSPCSGHIVPGLHTAGRTVDAGGTGRLGYQRAGLDLHGAIQTAESGLCTVPMTPPLRPVARHTRCRAYMYAHGRQRIPMRCLPVLACRSTRRPRPSGRLGCRPPRAGRPGSSSRAALPRSHPAEPTRARG